ncbi:hypothetical protein KGA66_03735 [Actinocrinis puniceicyclus]|uniref:Uncharacterized protein n=1 Tax=Actinocrinis puniceicyclus TaxID=977794 RepID=A0A8J7WLU3_9ACTN|nr:hypothetical protein [Actinocrinis puniceicyclus]MBS2962144.1 hypothetical protein [Actinocrinis puniceicyclus]
MSMYGHRQAAGPQGSQARAAIAAFVVSALVVGTVVARIAGYKIGGETIVRCRDGHYFTTIWIPGASLKAVRLGMARWQRCPVGKHWTLVSPVRDADLTDADRHFAEQHHDVRVP